MVLCKVKNNDDDDEEEEDDDNNNNTDSQDFTKALEMDSFM